MNHGITYWSQQGYRTNSIQERIKRLMVRKETLDRVRYSWKSHSLRHQVVQLWQALSKWNATREVSQDEMYDYTRLVAMVRTSPRNGRHQSDERLLKELQGSSGTRGLGIGLEDCENTGRDRCGTTRTRIQGTENITD